MACEYNPYTLPTMNFVGGETQDLAFHVYYYRHRKPFSLMGCECNFSVVNFSNRTGTPILSKKMNVVFDEEDAMDNVLTVTLTSLETVDLFGKYIYQIIIRDINGDSEIPQQGIMYISNNINKNFIRE